MEKIVNGIKVELVKGLDCKNCAFFKEWPGGVRRCGTTENGCLEVYRGGWRKVENELDKDPLFQ